MRHPNLAPLVLIGMLAGPALAQLAPPPAPPQRPVQDTYFGTTLTDPYRYMEKAGDPEVAAWLKAEGRYTSAVFGSVPGRAALFKEVADLAGSFTLVTDVVRSNGALFYKERAAGSDNFDLWTRDAQGKARKLVDLAAWRAKHGGKPYAVNYFLPSPDASKVAVGISAGGSEDASLYVYDVSSGKQIGGPLGLAGFGATAWTADSRKVFVLLQAKLRQGAPEADKLLNIRNVAWDLQHEPVTVLGGSAGAIRVPPEKFPVVLVRPGATAVLANIVNGTQNEMEIWSAPMEKAADPRAPWKPMIKTSDEVTAVDMVGDRAFLLSHQDAPTFKVLAVKVGEPLSAAKTIVAARPDRVIEGFAAAADGVYVYARRGVYSELFKVSFEGGDEQSIALPFKGSVSGMSADPRVPGLLFSMDNWVTPVTVLAYDPANGALSDQALGRAPAQFNPSAYVVDELSAKAKDGASIPLSYVESKHARRPQLLVMYAYGSYGMTLFPAFTPRWANLLDNDIAFAVCHVRGGGELGDAWRLAGKDANKPNTWRDLIACAEDVIARGYTTREKLFILGGSAGGITVGRAMEERPDLFAGVIDQVPAANTVRQEFFSNGVPNIPEFGTVKDAVGFRNLLAMDSYFNVKDGTRYPPILITTGLNDPRVPSWEPAKFAARLRTTGSKSPVLLRVDEEAGHGIGSTKAQMDALFTDIVTFVRWQGGEPGWTPQATTTGAAGAGK